MHLPSESINGAICPVTAVVATGVILIAARTLMINRNQRPSISLFAVTTLAVLAMQAVNYPLPSGFSGHLLGATFATALLGVPASILSLAVVITTQCLAFGDGGTWQLGANLLNMSVIAVCVSGAILHLMKNQKQPLAVFTASASAILLAVVAIAAELILSAVATPRLLSMLVLSHLPIAVIEGLATQLLLAPSRHPAWRPHYSYALAAVAVILLLLIPLSSSLPDALEWSLSY